MKKSYVKPKIEAFKETTHNKEEHYMNIMVDAGRPASVVDNGCVMLQQKKSS